MRAVAAAATMKKKRTVLARARVRIVAKLGVFVAVATTQNASRASVLTLKKLFRQRRALFSSTRAKRVSVGRLVEQRHDDDDEDACARSSTHVFTRPLVARRRRRRRSAHAHQGERLSQPPAAVAAREQRVRNRELGCCRRRQL